MVPAGRRGCSPCSRRSSRASRATPTCTGTRSIARPPEPPDAFFFVLLGVTRHWPDRARPAPPEWRPDSLLPRRRIGRLVGRGSRGPPPGGTLYAAAAVATRSLHH